MSKKAFTGFFIWEIFLYMVFLVHDFMDVVQTSFIPYDYNLLANTVKLISVFSCILFLVYLGKRIEMDPTVFLILQAFSFTFLADVLLLFSPYYAAGIFSFCVVQIFYRIHMNGWRKSLVFIAAGVCLSALFVSLLLFFLQTAPFYTSLENRFSLLAPIVFIGIFYFFLLISNIATAAATSRKLIMTGLICMLLCDSHVFLYNFLPAVSDTSRGFFMYWRGFCQMGMWFFYVPALLLLLLYAARYIQLKADIN